jgi:hypothetical protein
VRFRDASSETTIVPAIAVQKHEPRLSRDPALAPGRRIGFHIDPRVDADAPQEMETNTADVTPVERRIRRPAVAAPPAPPPAQGGNAP